MIINNGLVLLLLRKLCVRQILTVTSPRFSHPMRHVTDVRDVMYLPENSSVSISWATKWATSTRCIQFIANVHWLLLWFVSDILDRCLCYERIITPSQNDLIPPTPNTQIKGHPTKLFSEIQEKLMQTTAKPTLGLSGSSPHINIS